MKAARMADLSLGRECKDHSGMSGNRHRCGLFPPAALELHFALGTLAGPACAATSLATTSRFKRTGAATGQRRGAFGGAFRLLGIAVAFLDLRDTFTTTSASLDLIV
jgi:hypothetical protein